jgi:membrane protein
MEATFNNQALSQNNPSSLKEKSSRLFSSIGKHEIFLIAGSLAYTTALSIAPFVLILLAAASFLSQDMQNRFYTELYGIAGPKAGETIKSIVENADNSKSISGASGLVGFLILAFSASAIFAQLRIALDKINEHKETKESSGFKGFLKDRVFSIGLVFGFAFLSIASLMVTTVLAAVFGGTEGAVWQVVSFVVTFIAFAFLFAAIYRFVPSDRMSWRRCALAGAVSAIFYNIGKSLISLYLAKAGLESAYGAAGSLVVFLAWVFYTSVTILISYEFTRNFFHQEAKA